MVSTTVPLTLPGPVFAPTGGAAGIFFWVSSAVQQVATAKMNRIDRIRLMLLFMVFLQKVISKLPNFIWKIAYFGLKHKNKLKTNSKLPQNPKSKKLNRREHRGKLKMIGRGRS